jgi:hypothetical protein
VVVVFAAIEGHRLEYLLRREVEDCVELVVLTLWDSIEVIRKFALPEPNKALVEPEARAVLTGFAGSVSTRVTPAGNRGIQGRRSGRYRHASLESLREPSLQELPQLRRRLELRNGLQYLERGCERIRQTPDSPRPKFLVLWLEVQVMNCACQVFGSLQFAFHESFVDHDFRCDICEFAPLPGLDLLRMGSKFRCILSTPTECSRSVKTTSSASPAPA